MAPDTNSQPGLVPDREHSPVPVQHRCSLGEADRHARERGWDKDPLYVMNDCGCPLCVAERGESPPAAA